LTVGIASKTLTYIAYVFFTFCVCVSIRLIDSKVEESTHTYSASTKFDPVLSGNVTLQYQSSQRLMDEICEMNDRKKDSVNAKAAAASTTTSKKTKTSPSTTAASLPLKRNDVKKIVAELCRRTNTAVHEIAQQQHIYQQQQQYSNSSSSRSSHKHSAAQLPIKRGDRIELEGHPPVYTLVYHRDKKWQKPYCIKINATHYNKLYTMFVQVHGGGTGSTMTTDQLRFKDHHGKLTMTTHVFHYLVMILLLRYSSLSGGQLLLDLRGGGMQGAVHDSVFDTLSQVFIPQSHDTIVECFASPMNAYIISGYYSAFASDIDWHFGSRGNFLNELIVDGCCEANPPFAPGIMSAMADRIQANIAVANDRDSMVTFVVIVPHGGSDQDAHRAAAKRYGSIALQQMTESEYCTYHFILPAKEHGYIEGAQHLRPTRYKESLYDTSIVVLQSTKARRNTEPTVDQSTFEEQIRQAFVSRHRMEVESRK
jgi:phosphorylated CTD-interacting factor 1